MRNMLLWMCWSCYMLHIYMRNCWVNTEEHRSSSQWVVIWNKTAKVVQLSRPRSYADMRAYASTIRRYGRQSGVIAETMHEREPAQWPQLATGSHNVYISNEVIFQIASKCQLSDSDTQHSQTSKASKLRSWNFHFSDSCSTLDNHRPSRIGLCIDF